MMRKEYITKSSAETKKIGFALGKKIKEKEKNFFIALQGNLGSGKTTFTKGLARGLGIKEDIISPTFLIYKRYRVGKGRNFYHVDAFRVKKDDLFSLGFKEIMKERRAIVLVEWSENIKEIIPEEAIIIIFSFINPSERKLIVESNNGIIL